MQEVWKDVVGFEGRYSVSSFGRVKSIVRNYTTEKIMSPYKYSNGYMGIDLRKDGKFHKCLVHRLVAEAFLPNPHNYNVVNHKDEVRDNNRVDNLEWCTQKYNMNYGHAKEKIARKKSIPVLQFTKNGQFVRRWDSSKQVERELGVQRECITRCCKHKQSTSSGYVWEYA